MDKKCSSEDSQNQNSKIGKERFCRESSQHWNLRFSTYLNEKQGLSRKAAQKRPDLGINTHLQVSERMRHDEIYISLLTCQTKL